MLLSRQLLSSYEGDRPDLVTVVLDAHGFNDLLEKLDFLHRAEQQQQSVIKLTRTAKAQADAAARRLSKLEASDRQITEATALRVRALAGMNSLLQSKQSALASARAAQQAALAASRSRASRLQSQISRVKAQQAAAAAAAAASSSSASAPSLGRPGARAVGRLGDPVRDRAVRVRRPEHAAEQRRRFGLLPDHSRHLEGYTGGPDRPRT